MRSATLFAFALSLACPAFAVDVIRMKNGDVFRGEIIKQEFGKKVQIRFKDGNEKAIKWNEILTTEKEAETPLAPEAPAAEAPAVAPSEPATVAEPAAPVVEPAAPAAEPPPPAVEPGKPHIWTVYAKLGGTVGNKSKYTVKNAGGTPLANRDASDDGSVLWGIEALAQFTRLFGLLAIIESNKYNYRDGTAGDTHTTFLVMPRLQTFGGVARFWGGFGLGFVATVLGQDTYTSGVYTITFENSTTSFAAALKMGVDFQVNDRLILGVDGGYTSTSAEIKGSVRNRTTGAIASFSEDVTRGWWGLSAKAGYSF